MIGLGGSITSGIPESKYSADFDGTGDFIVLGKSNEIIPTNTSGGNVTLMCWVQINSLADNTYIFSNKRVHNSADSSNLSLRIVEYPASSGLYIFSALILRNDSGPDIHTNLTSDTNIITDKWYHIAITTTNSSQKLYVNGVTEATATNASRMNPSTSSADGRLSYIGKFTNNTVTYPLLDGLVSELSIFNAVLDEDDIEYVYDHPGINLNFNQGDYDKSSNLTHYYKMGDGLFDDKANGVVHDQDNPGFGSELVTGNNSTFSGTNDWTIYNPGGDAAISTTNGILVVTLRSDTESGTRLDISSSLTVGKTYKIEADVWLGTASENDGYRIFLGGVQEGIVLSTTQTKFIVYLTITDTQRLTIYQSASGVTGTFFIDNVSVKELNGDPGLTSSTGDTTFISSQPPLRSKFSLDFDGTDVLDTNQNFQDIFRSNFSISLWVKPDDGITNSLEFLCGSDAGGSNGIIRIRIQNGDIEFEIQANGNFSDFLTDNQIFSDGAQSSWTHILISFKNNGGANPPTCNIHVNGSSPVAISSTSNNVTGSDQSNLSLTRNFCIGGRSSARDGTQFGGRFYGKIDEFAIFDTVLDQNNVSAIYNSGSAFNLRSNKNLYTKSGNLKSYYKMGDNSLSNDRKNGEVHDQINPGRGNNLITNGDYSNGTTGWAVSSSGGGASVQTLSVNGSGQLVITSNDGSNGFAIQELTSPTIVGRTYKFKFDLISSKTNAGADVLNKIRIGTLNGLEASSLASANINNSTADPSLSEGVNQVFYLTASSAHTHLAIGGADDVDVLTIDNVSFEEFNANPGITSSSNIFSLDVPTD